jgi:hypothetical protein
MPITRQIREQNGQIVGVLEKVAATEFLGMEFLTWLYWHSETNNGKMNIPGVEEFELWLEAPIQLVSDYGEATNVTLKGGTPLEGPEARIGFRENKKLAKTRLRVNYRNQTFTCGFNALNFAITGLKIPAPPNASGPDYVFVRLEIFEEFEKFFTSIFETFLKLRLKDSAWNEQRDKLRKWVRSFDFA